MASADQIAKKVPSYSP